MKQITFWMALIGLSMIGVSTYGQTTTAKVRPLSADQLVSYASRQEALKEESDNAPAMLFISSGNSRTGLTVQAFNAKELPDGTVVTARKIVGGQIFQLGGTTFFGNMPPARFGYPFEDGTRATWTEWSGVNKYEIFTYFPDGSTSYSYLEKPVNKYWAGMFNSTKLITGATVKSIRGQLVVEVTGPITNTPNISVMIDDPEMDFDQWVPTFEVRGGKLLVSLVSDQGIPEGWEFDVVVGNGLGQTDKFSARTPIRPRAGK